MNKDSSGQVSIENPMYESSVLKQMKNVMMSIKYTILASWLHLS